MEAPVLVETITIPLKTRKIGPVKPKNSNNNNNSSNGNNNYNNNKNNENTGFPFDDSDFGDRDRSFRSHIDDIVQRHPELAEHLNFDRNFDRFPFRSNTWGPKRRGSASSGDESRPSGSTEFPEGRRFGRPFGSRFEERFGFPFSRTFDGEPEYCQQQKAQSQSQAEPKPQTQQEQENKGQQEESSSEKPPQVPNSERGRKQNPNIPQSSTVDLGQKQDPVHDTRGQRSMSAPPENRAGQQRYVSSINIPIQGGIDASSQQGAPQPPPQQQQQWQQQQPKPQPAQQSKCNERVIPIHVEGRDEPVIPKQGTQTFSQPPPQPERVFPQPQSERVFGQRPGFGHWERGDSPYCTGEQFFPGETQYFDGPQFFKNRAEPHHQRANPEEYFAGGPYRQQQQQQKPQQQQQRPQQQQQKPPQQQQKPQQQQQHQHQEQQPTAPPAPPQQQQQVPPPQPPPPKTGPIEQIQCIQKDVLQLMDQVEKFNGKPKDKQYLYLDEMLTRNLLKLDDIETEGKESIRQARKEAINCIQRCISILEAKAAANEQLRNQLMEVDVKLENPPAADNEAAPLTALEVSGVARSGTEVTVDEQPTEKEQVENGEGVAPMEVAPCEPVEAVKTKPEAAETKNPEEEPPSVEAAAGVMEVEQPQEEKKEQAEEAKNVSEQPAGEAVSTSQSAEATQEEVKDKKEKKKVKKKEKSADKAEKK